ncbi:NIPSNAP family protein [Gibbsiella quercinecans]|uniref:NIPSNAP family protein n=1 Tax=Gibbsiella quercinecans TaxID=929813 RepID=UPI001E570723|nr:NIPSNAP family protein [Gibbsiella quercinecans]
MIPQGEEIFAMHSLPPSQIVPFLVDEGIYLDGKPLRVFYISRTIQYIKALFMFYEMRIYTVKIGKLANYIKLFEDVGLPIISKYSKLIGYWQTESGELNQVIHIWEYDSLDVRVKKRQQLYQDKRWLTDFIPLALPMLEKQESRILVPSSFSPIK